MKTERPLWPPRPTIKIRFLVKIIERSTFRGWESERSQISGEMTSDMTCNRLSQSTSFKSHRSPNIGLKIEAKELVHNL